MLDAEAEALLEEKRNRAMVGVVAALAGGVRATTIVPLAAPAVKVALSELE